MLVVVMPAAEWAPWIAVFAGGCLSGAALLSFGVNRAPVATVAPSEQAPRVVEPAEPGEAGETSHEQPPRARMDEANTPPPPVEDEVEASAASAADILVELENAYQKQLAQVEVPVSESATPTESELVAEPPAPSAPSAGGEVSSSVATAAPPAAPPHAERVADVAAPQPDTSEPLDPGVARGDAEPHEFAKDQPQIQQVAVLYQPIVVVPAATPSLPAPAVPPQRSIGLDPWAPVQLSPRHDPWAITPPSGGVWGSVGPQGGVWGVGFGRRP